MKIEYDEIETVVEFGQEESYDLEVDHWEHSFFANDISVSNSHSISYSMISYICAYLMHYYEKEWIRACLEVDADRNAVISSIEKLGYKINKPNILKSDKSWTIIDKDVYPSLVSLTGIGDVAVEELIELRKNKNTLEELFFDNEVKQYKNGKTKDIKTWRPSKFNKKALDVLIKMEAFDDFGVVGAGKLFENYAHMHRAIIENYDQFKKGKESLEYFSNKIEDKSEWSLEEKIEHQEEIMGTYDKTLLISQETLDIFSKYDILPLSDLCELAQKTWFILKSFKKATTKTNKMYYKLTISDGFEVEKTLNYFEPIPEKELVKNRIYIAFLYLNDSGYINSSYGKKLVKL